MDRIHKGIRLTLLFVASLLIALPLSLQAAGSAGGKTIVIGCEWDFPPYEYNSNDGKPAGYHIELMGRILTALGMDHEFRTMSRQKMMELFSEHQLDLIMIPLSNPSPDVYSSRAVLNYYHLQAASLNTTPPFQSLQELKDTNMVIAVENGNQGTFEATKESIPHIEVVYSSSREALAGLNDGTYKYFVWGEEPLKWKIKELNMEDEIVLSDWGAIEIDIRAVSHDKALIDDIDKQITKFELSGEFEEIYDKWFHPERVKEHRSPFLVLVILGSLSLIIIVVYLLNRLTALRIKRATNTNNELRSMMTNGVKMGDFIIVQYDVVNNLISNRLGNLLPPEGLKLEEFITRLSDEDRERFVESEKELLTGSENSHAIRLRWNAGTAEAPNWRHLRGHSILEKDDKGKPAFTLNVVKDMTDEVERRYADDRMTQQYHMLFESSLVAMSFYSKDGKFIDINKKMRELCGVTESSLEYFTSHSLNDIPLIAADFDPKSREHFHTCQHMYYPEVGINKYIELRVRPIFDENDELIYYTVTARDVSDERKMYLQQMHSERELQKTNTEIEHYENQLRYLLEKSDMYVWTFELATRNITFSRSLTNVEFSRNRDEYIEWMVAEEREEANRNLMETMMKGKVFNAVHHFYHTPIVSEPCWFALSGMPSVNEKGQMTGYFGIARNVTSLMEIQEELKKETKRADESGKLKSVFLANMTHEIRTPLNAIVGFADVLQMVEASEERREFIRIIRNNCDMLLRLINDIIEASNMNEGPLSIERTDIDFAQAFNDICQTLSQRVQEPGVQFIIDNPYDTFPTHLDKGRMQQVITNFTTNAVKYTHQGHIKVGYRYENGGIYMYCEDTGAGIPKEKQDSVFERFVKLNDYVQGTGLGLSICKSIADRCNGKIGVDSEGEGKGSTFWIWIPCERKEQPINP